MKKNYFVYYATEENAYEIEKSQPLTGQEALQLAKSYIEEHAPSEVEEAMKEINDFKEEGGTYEFEDDYKGYVMIVGIAPKGKLCNVIRTINDYRKEIVGMF